jgi:hypothetical protein
VNNPTERHPDPLRNPGKVERRMREGVWVGAALLVGLLKWSANTVADQESEAGRQTVCDPSYPHVCIPPPPPDLDCGDIPHRRFRVIGRDSHRFDGDHDGIGCESG